MKKKQGIYRILNKVNFKNYVGSAFDMDTRRSSHWSTLRKNIHHNEHLQRAWNKYGEDAFEFQILDYVVLKNRLAEREQYFMDLLKVTDRDYGYNIFPKARINAHSEETKKKIGDANRRRVIKDSTREKHSTIAKNRSPEWTAKINNYLKNKTPEHLKNMGLAHRGRIRSDAEKRRTSETFKGRKQSPEHIRKRIKRGEAGGSKLKEGEVWLIRKLLNKNIRGSLIAKMFRVVPGTIRHIKTGKSWGHLTS